MNPAVERCARDLLETTPLVMHFLRDGMRSNRTPDLSVPQFRVLVFVHRHPGASLGDVSAFIGLSAPAMSKLVDGLAQRGLIEREQSAEDRRRVTLQVAPAGKVMLMAAREATTKLFAERLAGLSEQQLDVLDQALGLLREAFRPEKEEKRRNG